MNQTILENSQNGKTEAVHDPSQYPPFMFNTLTSKGGAGFRVATWDLSPNELLQLHKKQDIVFWDSYCVCINPPESYLEFLEKVSIPKELGGAELEGFKQYLDSNGDSVFYPQVKGKQYSPWRAWASNRSSTSRIVSKLLQLKYVKAKRWCKSGEHRKGIDSMIGFDISFPKEFSLKLVDCDRKEIIRIANRCLKRFFDTLSKVYGGKLGYFSNLHLWSTTTPLNPHLHFHINLLNAALKEGVFYRFQPYYTERDISNLRLLWKKCLASEGIIVKGNVDFFIHYFEISENKVSGLVHRLKYCNRRPLVDLVNFFLENSLPEFNTDWGFFLIEYTNRRGVLGFARELKKIIPFAHLEKKSSCPICNCQATRVKNVDVDFTIHLIVDEQIPLVYWDYKRKSWIELRVFREYEKSTGSDPPPPVEKSHFKDFKFGFNSFFY